MEHVQRGRPTCRYMTSLLALVMIFFVSEGESQTTELPEYPLYRIPVRVHVGASSLTLDAVLTYLREVNLIWGHQAAICFEFEVVRDNRTEGDGFDIFFKPELEALPGYEVISGLHQGDHDIQVRDVPDLYHFPPAIVSKGARTTAHELGHALGLRHDERSDAFLMRSGHQGIQLQPHEIRVARGRAALKTLPVAARVTCRPPTFNPQDYISTAVSASQR
ncbi:MAG: hypothetical protein OEU26_08080 [Candidatus Tectomicrobia bacterium]|nr:hypothetical protein [Candidatus Tectomicrobia bacterium]